MALLESVLTISALVQVVASQKQLEMKYKQAQQTAVRGVACLVAICAVPLQLADSHHGCLVRSWGCLALEMLYARQDDWYRRAELALSKGEEDLAREALKRRKAYEVLLQAIMNTAQRAGVDVDNMSCGFPLGRRCALSSFAWIFLQDNAQAMKAQLEQQKKATDTLIGNTRCAASSAANRIDVCLAPDAADTHC